MSAFYDRMQAVAIDLIRRFGRSILLVRPTRDFINPDKPWEGSDSSETVLTTVAVVVPPNQVRIFGLSALGDATEFNDLMQTSEQICIIADLDETDLKSYNIVRDGGIDWGITGTQILKPADTVLLTYIGIRR